MFRGIFLALTGKRFGGSWGAYQLGGIAWGWALGKLQECPASRDKALQIDTSAEGHPRVVTENQGDSALQSLGFCLHCVILLFFFLNEAVFHLCYLGNRLQIKSFKDVTNRSN